MSFVTKRRKAIFSNLADGTPYLPIWYNYYSKHFDPQDIYFLSFGTPKEVRKAYNCNFIGASSSIHNLPHSNNLGNEFKNELLKKYDWVGYADLDEILYYPEGFDSLLDQHNDLNFLTTTGYDIVQVRSEESKLDLTKPILTQRNYWYYYFQLNKPAFLSKPLTWGLGHHGLYEPEWSQCKSAPNRVENFLLVHLHKADYDIAKSLNQKNVRIYTQPTSGGYENFYLDDKFEQWFKEAEEKAEVIDQDLISNLSL